MPSLSIGPLTGVAEEKHLQKLQDKVIGLLTELSAAPAPRFFFPGSDSGFSSYIQEKGLTIKKNSQLENFHF